MANVKLVVPTKLENLITGKLVSFTTESFSGRWTVDVYEKPNFLVRTTKNGRNVNYMSAPAALREAQQRYVKNATDLETKEIKIA